MTAKQKSEDMFNSNYMLLMEFGEEYSEEILVSLLSIKFAIKQCDDMVKEFTDKCCEFQNRKYWEEVKEYLLEM
jgi:hypothetical protein